MSETIENKPVFTFTEGETDLTAFELALHDLADGKLESVTLSGVAVVGEKLAAVEVPEGLAMAQDADTITFTKTVSTPAEGTQTTTEAAPPTADVVDGAPQPQASSDTASPSQVAPEPAAQSSSTAPTDTAAPVSSEADSPAAPTPEQQPGAAAAATDTPSETAPVAPAVSTDTPAVQETQPPVAPVVTEAPTPAAPMVAAPVQDIVHSPESGVAEKNALDAAVAATQKPVVIEGEDKFLANLRVDLERYVRGMGPSSPVNQVSGTAMQRNLYSIYMSVIGAPAEKQNAAFDLLLGIIHEHRSTVFSDPMVFRFMGQVQLTPADREAFIKLTHFFITIADPKVRGLSMKQVDINSIVGKVTSQRHKLGLVQWISRFTG